VSTGAKAVYFVRKVSLSTQQPYNTAHLYVNHLFYDNSKVRNQLILLPTELPAAEESTRSGRDRRFASIRCQVGT
jgi:hypothetical protein